MLRGVAHSAFPLGLVYQLSLWVNRRKAVVFFVQISVVVSVVGTHVFLRVKCTHTPRLRTAYDMIHSYHSTTILRTKPSVDDLLRFFARRRQYKLSRQQACYSSECTKQTYLSVTRLLLTWPRELSSMDCPHTLLCRSTRTGACTPSPFDDPTTPKTKGERPQKATSMCVHVSFVSLLYW